MGPIIVHTIGLRAFRVIGYVLLKMSNSEAVESNAIAGAAESVGNAADNVGDGAGQAVGSPNC